MASQRDASCVYATVPIPYRDPATANDYPEVQEHKLLGRIRIPMRLGAGSDYTTVVAVANDGNGVPVQMLDGRKLMESGEKFSLDKQCFKLERWPTSVKTWTENSPQEVLDVYFPEIEKLLLNCIPNAERVLIFDHALRTGGGALQKEFRSNKQAGWGPYAPLVHSDNNMRSMHSRAKDWILGSTEVKERYGRWPPQWGDVRPSREWLEKLFRAERGG